MHQNKRTLESETGESMANQRSNYLKTALKRLEQGVSAFLLGTALTLGTLQPSFAVELPTAFETALKLTRAASTYNHINAYPAAYQFAIQIPAEVKQPLARVSIVVPGEFGAFGVTMPKKEDISVFIPTEPEATRPQVAQRVLPTQINIEGRTVLIDLPEPISSPQTVTVQFGLMRNPSLGGTYLFEVNAFPPGSQAVKQFVGYGRLVFRDDRGFR
jgi:Protein of unknown function (DUF2808)